jgi:cysteinyl-tRNA synthetase
VLEIFDSVFDVLKPSGGSAGAAAETAGASNGEINEYIQERQQAKKSRDFARADQIRALLESKGILLEDTKEGVRWKRK